MARQLPSGNMHESTNAADSSKPRSPDKLVRIGSIGVYAEDPSQVWGLILTFLTIFVWFVYINNDLGDLVIRSVINVLLFSFGTYLTYKFWILFYKRFLKKINDAKASSKFTK